MTASPAESGRNSQQPDLLPHEPRHRTLTIPFPDLDDALRESERQEWITHSLTHKHGNYILEQSKMNHANHNE